MILEYATNDAQLIPRKEIERRSAALLASVTPTKATMEELARAAAERGIGPLREHAGHMIAVTELWERELPVWLDDHALKAWLSACDNLEALTKPGELVKAPNSLQ